MLKSECQHYDTFTGITYGPSILIHDNGTTNMVMTHFHLHHEPKKFVNSMLKLPTRESGKPMVHHIVQIQRFRIRRKLQEKSEATMK